MAEKYIINMPLKSTPDDTDLMIIEDAQDTKRMTWANVVNPIKDLVNAKANKVWGNTITVTLTNGWTGLLEYSKNDLGEVWLRGSVLAGTVDLNTSIGAVATGYLPEEILTLVAYQSTNGIIVMFGTISTTGNITVRRNSNMTLEVETGKAYRINVIYKT